MCAKIPDQQAQRPLFVLLGVQPSVLSGYSEQQINSGEGQQGAEPKLFKCGVFF